MKYIALVGIMLFFILIIYNTVRLTYSWLKALILGLRPLIFGAAFGGITVIILALFVCSKFPDCIIPRLLLEFSHYALGALVYLALFVNITALVLWLGRVLRLIPKPTPRAVNMSALALCTSLILSFTLYGIINAKQLRTVSYTVDIGGEAEGFKIALISDLHLGYVVDEDYILRLSEKINGMSPDIICISGDIFDGDIMALSDKEKIKSAFKSFNAPVYACLGNHDAGEGYNEMLSLMQGAGVTLLLDEYTVIDNKILLVGRRDSSPIGAHGKDREEVILPSGNTLPVIVLDHQPSNIDEYGENADLILCGHTHNGQLFPGNLIVGAMFDAPYGYYRCDSSSPHVITTSGVGTWGPVLRVGSGSEIVMIELGS